MLADKVRVSSGEDADGEEGGVGLNGSQEEDDDDDEESGDEDDESRFDKGTPRGKRFVDKEEKKVSPHPCSRFAHHHKVYTMVKMRLANIRNRNIRKQ